MVPINQVISGGDPLPGSSMVGNSLDEQLQLIEKYKQNLEAAKQLRQQVQPVQQPAQHRMIWDDIDAEINPMSDEQKSRLLQDEDYVDTYTRIQDMVQAEILSLVKGRIEATPEGKELLQRQLKIVRSLKSKIIQDTNREMEMFRKFREFRNKFRDFMKRYRRDSMEHDGFMSLEDSFYPRRHEDDGFMDVFDSGSNRFGDRFRDSGMRGNDMDRIIKYMRHSMNDGEHFTESEAMDLVSDMYHTEGGRKYSGEKFDIHKAKEICERHRGVIPVSATPTDVYVAINSQYHDYVELFKSWFGDNVDQKIIESAIIFWFKDVDCKAENKVVEYLGEY